MATPPPTRRPLSNNSNVSAARSKFESSQGKPANAATTGPSTAQGLARSPSLRGAARPVRRIGTRPSISGPVDDENDSTKENHDQLISDLRESVERAEQASEQYRKQLEVLQKKLDESTDLQTAAEEKDFAARTQIDKLHADLRDASRQNREIERDLESERSSMQQEKESFAEREAELQSVVNKLKENLKSHTLERANTARMESLSALEGNTPPGNAPTEDLARIVKERDNTIESLKFELAEFHLKVAEHEHAGDGQQQALEKELRDIKMQNARLVEENDSFQMLLSQRTLQGGFKSESSRDSGGISTLAEELESLDENDEVPMEAYKKMEAEMKHLKEENKALTLYIDKIISKVMLNDSAEQIFTNEAVDQPGSMPPPKVPVKEKPLPAAPARAVSPNPNAEGPMAAVGGFLQRARSVVSRAPPSATRPQSYLQPRQQTANENPDTAPRIPLNKGHRRSRSDQANSPDLSSTNPTAAQNLNVKASPLRTASGSPMSSAISPLSRASTSYFAPNVPMGQQQSSRNVSQSNTADPSSSGNSIVSEGSLERQSTEATSYPASVQTKEPNQPGGNITAGVMKQNQLRPLRLVQDAKEDEEAMKRANRGSWMGWFNKGAGESAPQQS